MGSCFSQVVSKYEIPQQPLVFTGDINHDQIDRSKYRSKSSKSYAGTNTFEDVQHQHQYSKGDIYHGQGLKTLHNIRTMPNIQPLPQNVSYGLNPYVENQQVYKRSNTDNPFRVIQEHLNSQKQNGNFPFSVAQNKNGNHINNPDKNAQKSSKDKNANIKFTQSRYIDP